MELNLILTAAAGIVIFGVWLLKSEANNPEMPAEVPVPNRSDSDIKAELSDLRKAIERIHETAVRHDEHTEDAFRDIKRRVDRIERGVERIENHQETEARIGSALARMGRVGE